MKQRRARRRVQCRSRIELRVGDRGAFECAEPGYWEWRQTMTDRDLKIEIYARGSAVCLKWDPRAIEAARIVADALEPRMSGLRVEHVGSTAVQDCDGKGVVDLAVFYPAGELAATRDLVDSLGFQRQQTPDPFPEERPMRVGALHHAGRVYQMHVHILSADADEAAELLAFRDRLRSDSALRKAYIARKREIIDAGVSDPLEYCYAKGGFIDDCLGRGEKKDEAPATEQRPATRPKTSESGRGTQTS